MLTGNGGFGAKPKALMCYICGREYGTASLQIHLKTCMKKWEIEESKKPKKERRPMPQPPKQLSEVLDKINGGGNVNLAELETYNNKANDEYNDSALIRCDYCNRTFLPERLGIHRKICTPEKPFKPLPPSNTGKSSMAPSTSTSTSASTTKGFGGGSTGYSEQPKSSAMGRGGAGAGSGLKKPSAQPQYEEYNDDDDDNSYVPAKPTTKAQPVSKPSAQPKTQSYGGGGGYSNPVSEFADVQLVDCDICGRRFAADRIDRHIKACTKSQKGEAKHAKKVALAEKKQAETEKFIAKEAKFKKNNWRDQHNEFVANLKYNRKLKAVEEQGGDIRSLGPPPKMSAIESNMIECPYCARKFNPQSAEKHINICKNVVNKPKAVPGKAIPTKTSTQAPMRSSQAGFGGTPTKPTTTKTTASASKYGGGSYGTYDSLDNEYQNNYNPSNYGGPSSMSQARQTGFKDQPMQKPGLSSQYGAQPNSSRGVQPNSGRGSTQYGAGSQTGMNSSSRGGFGTKSTSSSLANAGKMAMQDYTNYNSPPSTKAAKTGYRY